MYNQHTKECRQPGTEVWLRGAEEKLFLETKALNTQKYGRKKGNEFQETPIFTNLKKRIRAHKASSKATRLFDTK